MQGRAPRLGRALGLILVLAVGPSGPVAADAPRLLSFDTLDGWVADSHAAALDVFRASCARVQGDDWEPLCALADTVSPARARAFFEHFFQPVQIGAGEQALFTGYFEPELPAARQRRPGFEVPVLRAPQIAAGQTGPSRARIDSGALASQGLELAWLSNPADLYYLQMQGSGRLVFADGSVLRLGYGGQNGHPRRSISDEAVRRGILEPHQASARAIRAYVARHPAAGRDLLRHDPSYVFFHPRPELSARTGPVGALGVPLTPLRSVAVDRDHVPLGAPVWIERGAMRRLMVAQDVGGAIRGPQRADLFFGTGAGAEDAARRVRDGGRMVMLLPIEAAFRLTGGR